MRRRGRRQGIMGCKGAKSLLDRLLLLLLLLLLLRLVVVVVVVVGKRLTLQRRDLTHSQWWRGLRGRSLRPLLLPLMPSMSLLSLLSGRRRSRRLHGPETGQRPWSAIQEEPLKSG
jgi:hypothetical protein